ncbi:hypothetical protein MMC14_007330 [Varicellaria rhodocarpa]|nr:hypothetical protein [Varicellaria rhodocarpa]
MPLIQDSYDSLPYLDPLPTPLSLSQASALIAAALPPSHTTTPHPLLPPSAPFIPSPLIAAELSRIASNQPIPVGEGIDTSRYEALEPPTNHPSPEQRQQTPEQHLEAWRDTLRRAYTSSTHLNTRLQNLALLETFGKNAWLVGNAQLESVLRGLEKELVEMKEQVEGVERERAGVQEGVRGEMEGLQANWKQGVGRLLEVEVAAEGTRREILTARRGGAV